MPKALIPKPGFAKEMVKKANGRWTLSGKILPPKKAEDETAYFDKVDDMIIAGGALEEMTWMEVARQALLSGHLRLTEKLRYLAESWVTG